jgi:NAD(P)-dependent dehydrogenase (short-subunit alcohol dehydrogenase family)
MAQLTPANFFDFSGQVVVVTGAGRGIGAGIARRFAQAGATTLIHYHTSQAGAERLAGEIRSTDGGSADTFSADLACPEQVESLFEQIWQRFGRLDVLVNNAGSYPVTPLVEMKPEDWDGVISANLRSVFLCTQAAARLFIAQGQGGSIINISSVEDTFPAWGHSHYNAAKAGVLMFTRSVARELGQHQIRVNAVSPGLIGRSGLEQDWPDGVGRWMKTAPLQRLGEPEDVGDACLFLASPAARWITGIDLVVDGGVSTTPAF